MNKIVSLTLTATLLAGAAHAMPNDARRDECRKQAEALIGQMTPEERLNELMMGAPGVKRLGIAPYDWWNEALHGLARNGLATVFPQSIGAAATFDAPLMKKVGDVVSTEARAKYNLNTARGEFGRYRGLTVWSPNVNMFRDPRWGRGQETFGEDPYLSGVIGGAYVRGLQGDDAKYIKVAACAKHYAVHSGPERLRHGFSAKVSKRDIAEYYLPAFKALVKDAKVESVMSAYSAINGRSCTANKWLLSDLLRGEWGFKGHVVSDVGAVGDVCSGHHHAPNKAAGSLLAMEAGLDLCSEGTYGSLRGDVKNGKIPSAKLAAPLTNLYTTRALLGMFDPKGSTPWDKLGAESVDAPAHRAVALKQAEESLVLISNKGALPLDLDKYPTVAVVGPLATSEVALLGNYCGYNARPVTCLSGMVAEVGPAYRVTSAHEFDGDVRAGVICLGYTAEDEGEEGCSLNNRGGDRGQYGLPKSQLDTMHHFRRRLGKRPLIAVVFGGSPIDLKPVVDTCDAVLLAWYPGEEGGTAIARTILGRNNPSGRLPITYPASYDDLPDFKEYALTNRTYRYATKKPAYPFGYGLSYTTFAYANAKVEKAKARGEGGRISVSVEVTNTGKYAGDEVVQAYVRAPEAAKDRRLHHLEGIVRVTLAPGEKKTVTLELPEDAFVVYDEEGRAAVPAGESTVFLGGGQPGFATTVSATVGF